MTKDSWGNTVSYASPDAVRALDQAILKLHAYQADPLADIDAVLAQHPDFAMAHAFRAGMLATATDKAFEPELRKSVAAAEALALVRARRERGHIAAARAWLDGDFEGATELWGRTAIDNPRDSLAIQLAHVCDFFLGYSQMLRNRVARVLPHWDRGVPGYGYVLGMYAFGLEETGEYSRAEAAGRQAVEIDRRDGWAAHAVAHVMEMQGRFHDGAAWLEGTAPGWSPGSMFAYHNWWHLALFHLEKGDAAQALRIFDERVSAGGFAQALELVDGSALLWRLMALGHDEGGRWNQVADKWASRIEDGYYVFNDWHAMMALAGAGRVTEQFALLAAAERAAEGAGTNAMMTREVGLPAMRGFQAFTQGDWRGAVKWLMPLPAKANRFGGSHAQRDLFSWTLIEAALRAKDRALANALIAERLALKPGSPTNNAWAARAQRIRELAVA
jgi:tetratricopeptide (TPR) repeat protein